MPIIRNTRAVGGASVFPNAVGLALYDALTGIPALPAGLCVDDDPRLWDETVQAAIVQRNKTICAHCPEKAPCAAWASSLGRGKLVGVVAGKLYGRTTELDRSA